MMKRIAVYKTNGKLFAEFATLEELCRVLRVQREKVLGCLVSPDSLVFTKRTARRTLITFSFREVDSTKQGRC